MEIKKYQKIETRTTVSDDEKINEVLTMLNEVKLAMKKNDCSTLHMEFYECEENYSLAFLETVIEFLENFKTLEEIY